MATRKDDEEDDQDFVVYGQVPTASSHNDAFNDLTHEEAEEDAVGNGSANKDENILLPGTLARQERALDTVISNIGMGRFQWQLLVCNGYGSLTLLIV